MCGFAAVMSVGGPPVERCELERMGQSIQHRGPDDAGFFFDGDFLGIAFRRLSILDLSPAAHQPMLSEDERYVLAFNGEIYNYIELRDELSQLGHTFHSSGDSEVLLRAYQEWGMACLEKMNGMWAFIIYDRQERKIYGARDRFGKKPLYAYCGPGSIVLASEIKAIRASTRYNAMEPNWPVVSKYFLRGSLDTDCETFYPRIYQVEAGTAFEIDCTGQWRTSKYWSLDDIEPAEIGDPKSSYAALFEDAVRLRLRSDVPVGVSLSGGLDSTGIICAMSKLRRELNEKEPISAFSYMDKDFDETRYIEDTIEATDATLFRLESDPLHLWSTVQRMLWYQDEPVHTLVGAINFEIMRLAQSKGVKVILGGQGADETCAGYPSYFQTYWSSLLVSGRLAALWKETTSHCRAWDRDLASTLQSVLKHSIKSLPRYSKAYRAYKAGKWAGERRRNGWFTEDFTGSYDAVELEIVHLSLGQALRHSVRAEHLPLYLRIEDRNSMAHSIEARLPFLDYRLVTLLFQLPDGWKLRGPWNKYIQRQAMQRLLPESVRSRRDKMGFPVPVKRWFSDVLYEPVNDLLHSRSVRERGIYNLDKIYADLKRQKEGRGDVSEELLRVVQFEILFKDGLGHDAAPPA